MITENHANLKYLGLRPLHIIEKALRGEEVIIKAGKASVSVSFDFRSSPRQLSAGNWRVWIAEDFDELPEDILRRSPAGETKMNLLRDTHALWAVDDARHHQRHGQPPSTTSNVVYHRPHGVGNNRMTPPFIVIRLCRDRRPVVTPRLAVRDENLGIPSPVRVLPN